MRKYYFGYILGLLLLHNIGLVAQCDTGAEPECQCSTAEVLCSISELDGFTFSMSEFEHPDDGPDPMCSGTSNLLNNPNWFSFVPWCEDITLTFEISNCTQPTFSFGVQVAVYEDCNSYVDIACNADDCGNEDDKILNLNSLTIGAVYHIVIDGCAGSACDVTIVVDGSCPEEIEDWTNGITGPTTAQSGEAIDYTTDDLDGATSYVWSIDGVEDAITSEPTTEITWDALGTYELCVDVYNECIDVTEDPVETCIMVTVINPYTMVSFASTTHSETEGNIQSDICISIANEDPINATNCEVQLLSSSSATNGIDYNTIGNIQNFEFPAGSAIDQCFSLSLIDDLDIEQDETVIFEIVSVSGGNNAGVSSPEITTFTIIDNDDVDGDGIGNTLDNCVANFNPGQEDLDNDGIGDVCDMSNDVTQLFESKDNIYINKNHSGVIIKSPDGNCWILTVNNNGAIQSTAVECP